MKRIYLDHASITPMDSRVRRVIHTAETRAFGNPSSIYREGVSAMKLLEDTRRSVARSISALPDEIVFTSGGTEANNIAIIGFIRRIKNRKIHAVTSAIEHASVLEPLRALEREGLAVTYIPVTKEGIVDLDSLKKALRPETVLVSIHSANNEIGTIQPIREIAKIIRHHRKIISRQTSGETTENNFPLFHSDACQAPLYLPLDMRSLGVDFLVLDGQKMYGPRGVGALWVRRGVPLSPILHGGGQERGFRSGTENVPAIAGFAKALELAVAFCEKESKRLAPLRDALLHGLKDLYPGLIVNGSLEARLPSNVNVSIPGIDNEFFTLQLDAAGISISTKSSCLRDDVESYVVRALGGPPERAKTSLRFSLGRGTKKSDINLVLRVIRTIVDRKENG